MRRSWIPPVAVPLGVAAGFVGARLVLVGSGLILIPWGLLAAVLGLGARGRRSAAATGGLFGFTLAVTFMIAGYDGGAPLASRLAPFALLGLVGAVAAAIPSVGARLLAGRLARRPGPPAPARSWRPGPRRPARPRNASRPRPGATAGP